jgi:hypothetical protein
MAAGDCCLRAACFLTSEMASTENMLTGCTRRGLS